MINIPTLKPKTPLEEVVEILAEGIYTLVIRGDRPNRPRGESPSTSSSRPDQKSVADNPSAE
jgi:hypothetical protein